MRSWFALSESVIGSSVIYRRISFTAKQHTLAMNEIKIRFEALRSAVSVQLNEGDTTPFLTLRGESINRNINYHRRALYSDVELFKMELEEYLGSDENGQLEGGEREDNKKDGKVEASPTTIRSPLLARTDDTISPMAGRATHTVAAGSISMTVDGSIDCYNSKSKNSSSIYTDSYNDIDTHGSADSDRLLDTSVLGSEDRASKYSIIVDKDWGSKTNTDKVLSVTKNILSPTKTGMTENDDSVIISQMIEECSSLSANISLKFAQRNNAW